MLGEPEAGRLTSNSSLDCDVRELYFIFSETAKHQATLFCRSGFKHCYIVERFANGWMLYDPTRLGLIISIPPCESNHSLIENMLALDDKTTAVKVITNRNSTALMNKLKIITCVSQCQYISGINFSFFCLTPYKLYKSLLNNNHENIVYASEITL